MFRVSLESATLNNFIDSVGRLNWCPYKGQNEANSGKLVGKENHLEGLSEAGLVLLNLVLGFAVFGLEGRGSTTELPPHQSHRLSRGIS